MIRIEFWNGQLSNKQKYVQYGGLVTTNHNPCLWTSVNEDTKPWRKIYKKAIEYIDDWKMKKIDETELLHCLRYVAYGYNNCGDDKRDFNNTDVIWPGNLTINHKPKLVYKNDITNENFTLYFYFENNFDEKDPTKNHWKIQCEEQTFFYWEL